MKLRRAAPAEVPTNARIEYADGRVVPLELTYDGFTDGAHLWTVANVDTIPRDNAARLAVDTLPAHTAIRFPAPWGLGEGDAD